MCPRGGSCLSRPKSAFTFIAPMGLPPQDSHACCTPWSVFQDGSDAAIWTPTTAAQGVTDPPPEQTFVTGHCKQSPARCPNGQRRPGPGGPVLHVRKFATLLSRRRTARRMAVSSTSVRGGYLPNRPCEPAATVVGQFSSGVQTSRPVVRPPAPNGFRRPAGQTDTS